MTHSKKLTAAIFACLLTAPALAEDMLSRQAPDAAQRQAQRLDKLKAHVHERAQAMAAIDAKLDSCVQAATSVEAVKACHMQARDARKAYFAEHRASTH
jgi:hypothetical protein